MKERDHPMPLVHGDTLFDPRAIVEIEIACWIGKVHPLTVSNRTLGGALARAKELVHEQQAFFEATPEDRGVEIWAVVTDKLDAHRIETRAFVARAEVVHQLCDLLDRAANAYALLARIPSHG